MSPKLIPVILIASLGLAFAVVGWWLAPLAVADFLGIVPILGAMVGLWVGLLVGLLVARRFFHERQPEDPSW